MKYGLVLQVSGLDLQHPLSMLETLLIKISTWCSDACTVRVLLEYVVIVLNVVHRLIDPHLVSRVQRKGNRSPPWKGKKITFLLVLGRVWFQNKLFQESLGFWGELLPGLNCRIDVQNHLNGKPVNQRVFIIPHYTKSPDLAPDRAVSLKEL